ncbi:peptidase S8/S53 domain-containing protein [Lentinula guzmanii]|uniref:tripeptidyl-peptidase II n=1 Tax=Lentinula guzmanii TaxID=2804957 RepID=A0AA38MRB4_9AGAR|nr:peptidase S8/S53 domain-containing protein [Lentinula guzmanii]
MRSLLSCLAILTSFVLALPSQRDSPHQVKERVFPPRDWEIQSIAPSTHKIELKIGLPQPNFHILEKHLYEVSDPSHTRYGQHLSKEEVEALVAPHPESLELVTDWLVSHGIGKEDMTRSPAQDWITVTVPVGVAEKMLDTTYYVWKHTASGESIVRTTSYSLPIHLHEHVDVIQPTTTFARLKSFKSTIHRFDKETGQIVEQSNTPIISASGISVDPSCNTTVTVTCLKQLYNATDITPSATINNSFGITGYLDQFANFQDLQSFYAIQVPEAVNSSFTVLSVAGGQNNQTLSEAGDEADLDIEFGFGITFPINGTFFTTAGSPPFIPDLDTPTDTNEPYTTWLDFILAQDEIPLVITTSYGDDEQTVPESFAKRACAGFAQLGARGVSLTFSSGDGGVGDGDPDPATQSCITNDGTNRTEFLPLFPASCPYVTAVGGTIHVPEVAVDFSGGGFSNYFARPAYQDAAVAAFFDNFPNGTFAGLFNPNGRAFPDVAAQADNFQVIIGGETGLIGGTSAASPTFAGFVALLNDARLKAGLPSLGFLNPLFYSTAISGFNDITSGNAPGCGTEGFNATVGWDPVTGLGTPDVGKLVALVTSV